MTNGERKLRRLAQKVTPGVPPFKVTQGHRLDIYRCQYDDLERPRETERQGSIFWNYGTSIVTGD